MLVFSQLEDFLRRVPAVESLGRGSDPDGSWWVKLTIDIDNELAWSVVQEFAYVLNYLSIKEPLPTVFKPVSPPPYLNGGPREFLSWVIECVNAEFTPALCAQWLEARLPKPVDDPAAWHELEDDDETDE